MSNDSDLLSLLFEQVEKHTNIETWQFQNVHFWPIFKLQYFNKFIRHRYSKNKIINTCGFKKYQKFYSFYKFIRIFVGLIIFNLPYLIKRHFCVNKVNFTEKPVVFLIGPSDWLENVGSEKIDRILGPVAILAQECGFCPIKWESSSWYNTFKAFPYKAKYPIKFMQPIIDYLTFIKLPFVLRRLNPAIKLVQDRFNDNISTKFNFDLAIANEVLTEVLHCCVLSQLVAKLLYKHIFKVNKENIKAVFVVGTLINTLGLGARLLAKELEIPVIEIQHGDFISTVYKTDKLPQGGYNTYPDYWWIWGQKEYHFFSRCNDYHKVMKVGNLWALSWNEGYYKPNMLFHGLNSQLPKIIVTLSPMDNTNGLTNILLELIVKYKNKIFWILRLHPRMNQKIQEELFLKELKACGVFANFWIQCSNIMSAAETVKLTSPILHMTFTSSFAREAAVYNIPTLVIESSSLGKYVFTSNYVTSFKAGNILEASVYIDKALKGELKVDNSLEYFNIDAARNFFKKLKQYDLC